MSRAFHQGGFIGSEKSIGRCFIECLFEHAVPEALRGLCHHYALTRDGRLNQRTVGGALDLLHGIDRGQSCYSCAVFSSCFDYFPVMSVVTKGRTASCTKTMSSSAAETALSAFATDCWRCSPPATSSTFFFFTTSFASVSNRARKPAISLALSATQISVTASTAANLRSVCMRIGSPPKSVNCLDGADFLPLSCALGTGAMRVPRPAAGMITTTFMAGCNYTGVEEGVQINRGSPLTGAHPIRAGL